MDERLETGEISFHVDHPDFVPDRPFAIVSTTPTASTPFAQKVQYWKNRLLSRAPNRPAPVVLQRGCILKVSGYIDKTSNLVAQFEAEVSGFWTPETNAWRKSADGFLVNRRIPAGDHSLRLVHRASNSNLFFSRITQFTGTPGQTNELRLELTPGLPLSGKLGEEVPRPVKRGRVIVEIWLAGAKPGVDSLRWHSWAPVDTNGTFNFQCLPSGQMEVVALSDGFISKNGPPRSSYGRDIRLPQIFDFDGGEQALTVPMEPTAICEILVLDTQNHPVKDATVGFGPNIVWGGFGTRIFGSDLWNAEPDVQALAPGLVESYRGRSDAAGIAVVSNLPPPVTELELRHPQFELPVTKTTWGQTRSAWVHLIPGQTTRMTVQVQKSGTQALKN